MLILVVVIAILATNLFMGFFIAHYLGYGPQNFQELWTGVYLRPPAGLTTSSVAHPRLDPQAIEALTQEAARRLQAFAEVGKPCPMTGRAEGDNSAASNDTGVWTDAEVVQTIWRAQQMLQLVGMVADRWRLLDLAAAELPTEWSEGAMSESSEPGDGSTPTATAAVPWDAESTGALILRWRQQLSAIQWVEPVGWWRAYLQAWDVVQTRWFDYQQTLAALARLQATERAFQREHTAIVCENGTCRRVAKVAAKTRWWQRPSAELRTMAWVHQQRERLHQELFDQFVAWRKAQQDSVDRTLRWLRETFRPELLQETAAELGFPAAEALASSAITEAEASTGHLLVLRWPEPWVAEFCWGCTVVAAHRQHAEQRLSQWYRDLTPLDAAPDADAPLRLQQWDAATTVCWLSSAELEDAQLTAWTLVNALVADRREVEATPLELPLRVVVVPLTPRQPTAAAVRLAIHGLDDETHPVWEDDASPVWLRGPRRWEATPRPPALPCLPVPFDLVAWYTGDNAAAAPAAEPTTTAGHGENPAQPAGQTRGPVADAAENGDNGRSDPSKSSTAGPEDDGIEW
jgi:hypothetical protein